MENTKKRQGKKLSVKIWGIVLSFCLIVAMLPPVFATAADDRKLQNGSFEEGQTWTDKKYYQPPQENVPSWSTTAFEGKIELFRENVGTYITGVTLKPSHGSYAAELNADEESSLYQVVKTSPSSIYEWGLDHGGRTTMDTMALVIGPKQSVNPSKPSKAGRDQLMQMVDWLIDQGLTSVKSTQGLGEKFTVYSKKFGTSGTFIDNAGNNAFSMTPSTIYTEEWHIWIMADGKATSGTNSWGKYGSNADGTAGSDAGSGGKSVDLSKYYLYTVPAGQTETVFAFVSVGCKDNQGKTYGNFLDNINFQLYHPLSGSTTTHGSAVIGSSGGNSSGEGSSSGHTVTVDGKLTTYVTDGEALKVQAIIEGVDAKDGCEFVGLYYTTQDENGNPVTRFLMLAGNTYDENTNPSGWKEEKDEPTGKITYTCSLANVTTATDLHFVFIKSPTITYDSNGGKDYVVERTYNNTEAKNVYSFKPAVLSEKTSGVDATTGATPSGKPKELFIDPYVSHAAEGQNDGWKFMGWKLTGSAEKTTLVGITKVNADQLNTLLLPAEHTIACDYDLVGQNGDTKIQYFKIYKGNVSLTKNINKTGNEVKGVTWNNDSAIITYADIHRGLTLVAQWRWLQAFIPQVGSGSNYTNSDSGGTVEITSVTNTSDTNYNAAYNANGGKSYHAETDETIKVKAIKKPGYTFEGWYDAKGNLITTNPEYTYTETKETVNTYYARFSGSVTQTYIRQVKNGDTWVNTTDDNIGTLGRYTYTDAPGTKASSTATDKNGYKFVGWYDTTGNKVPDSMLINGGATISYTTTGNATYYARFETGYTVYFVAQTQQENGKYQDSTTGGSVSVASVKDVNGKSASSKASATQRYKFVGWYDKDGNLLGTDATFTTTTTPQTNGQTYYARFNFMYTVGAPSLSFVAESEDTSIPPAFDGRHAGTGKNTSDYGLQNKYGNTIATGFPYSIVDMTNVKTIQITVTVPASAYVKVGGTGSFSGKGNPILSDSDTVCYNKGSIYQINKATTLTYYWDATSLSAGQTYGFIIDNLYAPGATATITINGTSGTKVTNDNGVVNTASGAYRGSSHYPK